MRNEAIQAIADVSDWEEALARVAHELRGPLTSILGWAALLQTRRLSGDELRHAVEIIAASARAQRRLVEDLLDHAHIAHGKLRLERVRHELGALVKSAVHAATPLAADAGVLLVVRSVGRALVDGDPLRLRQVVDNLLHNAIRYSPPGGRVDLVVEQRGGEARLSVRDRGMGIPPSLLPHVFERYRRGEDSRGLGLGLAITRHIVEEHGGTIAAESAGEHCGATFTVCLPCDQALALASTAA